MTTKDSQTSSKILTAATELFANKGFDSVSIKDIASFSETNSALISYYFGGKKQLYVQTVDKQIDNVLKMQKEISASTIAPLEKILLYAKKILELQLTGNHYIRLIYNELFNPTGYCDDILTKKLLQVHGFTLQLVENAMDKGYIRKDIPSEHIAFTIGGMMVFFFIAHKHITTYASQGKITSPSTLEENLNIYLQTLTTGKRP